MDCKDGIRDMTDAQAVRDVAKGGTRALRLLMDRYGDMVYRLVLSVLCDRDEADDVAQEVFIKVWKNASRYDPAYNFSTWVCRMAYNLSIDRLRKAGRRRRADSEQYMMRGQSVPFSDPVEKEDAERLLKHALERLRPSQRTVFYLSEILGVPHDEISEITGMGYDSVKSNLYHARKNIKEMIEGQL